MNPTCIVTGSASGIGAATVLALARAGHDTFGIDLDLVGAEHTSRQASIECPLTRHAAACADVAEEAGLTAAFAQGVRFLGRLDALATCAGVVDTTPFMDISVTQFRRIHDVNVVGTWLCMREAARGIRVNSLSPGATDTPMIAAPLQDAAHRQRIEQLAAQKRIGAAAKSPRASSICCHRRPASSTAPIWWWTAASLFNHQETP